jgi:hypothetical protein
MGVSADHSDHALGYAIVFEVYIPQNKLRTASEADFPSLIHLGAIVDHR